MSKKNKALSSCRLNKVGGQAVLEGVMMKAGERTVTTCRKEDGSIVVNDDSFVSVRKKHKWLNIPILRGCVNFVEMMILSVKTLGISAEALDIEDEKEKARRRKAEAEGKKTVGTIGVIMSISVVLGLLLSVGLFLVLPSLVADGINAFYTAFISNEPLSPIAVAVIDGVMKVVIFIAYLALVSLMPDIRRTFQYHGAEHKSIACFEAGVELTPENAKKYKRFHPRCGTSFMFLMILLGIFIGMFVRFLLPTPDKFPAEILYSLTVSSIKILLLPITMGVGYEILMLAGRHDNVVTRIISAPGLWVQRITTKEPDESQLEIAIISIKCALRDEFPEYREFWESREWESNTEQSSDAESAEDEQEIDEAPDSGESPNTEHSGADPEKESAGECTGAEEKNASDGADGTK